MDVFGYARHWMMHSSHAKRPFLHRALLDARRQLAARALGPAAVLCDGHGEAVADEDLPLLPLVCVEVTQRYKYALALGVS